jgi:hypothetical protein
MQERYMGGVRAVRKCNRDGYTLVSSRRCLSMVSLAFFLKGDSSFRGERRPDF